MVRSILLSTLFLVCAAQLGASEATYCSLTVRVTDQKGREVVAPVRVREGNGRIVEAEHRPGRPAKFCDLGVIPVTIEVGGEQVCNQVVVRNARLEWRKPVVVTITDNYAACLREEPPSPIPQCWVLLRIKSEDEKWISAAKLTLTSPQTRQLTADRFGRVFFAERAGAIIVGEVIAPGYQTSPLRLECTTGRSEQLIELATNSAARLIPLSQPQ